MQACAGRTIALISTLACSGGASHSHDAAAPDAPRPDAAPLDPVCGTDAFFTSEFVDWASTDTVFRGIPDALWTVQDHPERTDASSPNGRVELCLPREPQTLINITAPGTYWGGVALVTAADVGRHPASLFSTRSIDAATRATFLTPMGQPLAEDRAHLFVTYGAPTVYQPLAVAGSEAMQSTDGAHWIAAGSAAEQGRYVLFANIDPNEGHAAIVNGGAILIEAPIAAGTITYVSLRDAM